jgi:hypothetical protein
MIHTLPISMLLVPYALSMQFLFSDMSSSLRYSPPNYSRCISKDNRMLDSGFWILSPCNGLGL